LSAAGDGSNIRRVPGVELRRPAAAIAAAAIHVAVVVVLVVRGWWTVDKLPEPTGNDRSISVAIQPITGNAAVARPNPVPAPSPTTIRQPTERRAVASTKPPVRAAGAYVPPTVTWTGDKPIRGKLGDDASLPGERGLGGGIVQPSFVNYAPRTVTPPEPLGRYDRLNIPYPEAARKRGVSGVVVVRLLVDQQGKVATAQLLKTLGFGLDRAALTLVKRFRFRPARDHLGRAIPTYVIWTFHVSRAFVRGLRTKHAPC